MVESEALKRVADFRYNILIELLNQCRPEQQELFNKLYPGGPEKISSEKIDWAIQQCENTLRKNNKVVKEVLYGGE